MTADLDCLVVPGLSLWQHPRFFGYFPANALHAGILADLVSTGLGVIGLSWQSSPAVTEIEEVVTDWLRQMLGLPPAFSGVIQDTASTSTLVALICARERATNYALARGGLQGEKRIPRVYVSAHAHSSVDKGALLAGFGRDNLRLVPFDAKYAMRADALGEMIADDLANGDLPCAIVATVGTTATTAIDPIAPSRRSPAPRVWLHVDAAMAGSAMILPECRSMWEGIEGADLPGDQRAQVARRAVRLLALLCPRSRASDAGDVDQSELPAILGRRRGQEPARLGHSARAPLPGAETLVRHPRTGRERIAERLRRDMANARWLADKVAATPGWRVLAPVPLQTVCVRHEPEGTRGEALDKHTTRWVEAVNRSGAAYLTPAVLDGRWMARVSIGALATETEDVAAVWAAMREAAEGAGGA